ncbi:MAG TPA: AraC family transcriptional regulator, partial [Lachnospiraceae bacterium]|nr:AraC family transcriptional regulator [Lachnospiraceae bacterium]
LSPNKYLQTLRVAKARHLLETSRLSIESIACSCGYQKPESLIKVFRQFYGISPAAYRKRVNEHSMQTARRMTEAGVSEDLIP